VELLKVEINTYEIILKNDEYQVVILPKPDLNSNLIKTKNETIAQINHTIL
jgi:hypothetical protein